MKIDFSWSIEDWMALIKEFFEIIQNFFQGIGINIFSTADETTAEGESEPEA